MNTNNTWKSKHRSNNKKGAKQKLNWMINLKWNPMSLKFSKKVTSLNLRGANRRTRKARVRLLTTRRSCFWGREAIARKKPYNKLSKRWVRANKSSQCWTCTNSSSKKSHKRTGTLKIPLENSHTCFKTEPGVKQKLCADRGISNLSNGKMRHLSNSN